MRSSFFIYLTFCLSFLVKAAEITATTTTADDATTDTETSSSSVSPTMIWVTGTLSGALATYQTVYSQSFMPTYTSGTVISSGAPDASSYDYSSAKASASSASAAASSSSSGSAAFSASNAVAWIQAAVVASTMVVVVAMLL